jgi:LmbE family N-acetylglucosaminyl deacetylase
MSVLIVVAHPDDEVLGCGATGAAIAASGVEIRSCLMSGKVNARSNRPEDLELMEDIQQAQEILGFGEPIIGDFPNISFNTVPHLDLVQFIEKAITETNAHTIFTHHPGDLNNDHLHCSLACQAAARLFQRRPNITPLIHLYYMEVLSATDWAFAGNLDAFKADTFFPVDKTLEKKIEALKAYRGVRRDHPHPRSRKIVESLASFRGGQAGMNHAEAFQTAFHRLSVNEI